MVTVGGEYGRGKNRGRMAFESSLALIKPRSVCVRVAVSVMTLFEHDESSRELERVDPSRTLFFLFVNVSMPVGGGQMESESREGRMNG